MLTFQLKSKQTAAYTSAVSVLHVPSFMRLLTLPLPSPPQFLTCFFSSYLIQYMSIPKSSHGHFNILGLESWSLE